jgi:hypothetical protein
MSGLFSQPKPTPPARMPADQNDPAVRAAAEQARRAAMARSGRDSTVLVRPSSGGGGGGGNAYRHSLLGQSD